MAQLYWTTASSRKRYRAWPFGVPPDLALELFMTNGFAKNLKFYCPAHQIRFDGAGQTVVSCEQGGHSVGSGFPKASWWEFCCDCGTFWPADPTNGDFQRTECRVCERSIAKRY